MPLGVHDVHEFELEVAGRTLLIETGRMAKQANGAARLRYGDSIILATVVASNEPREGIDFFPLMVDYEEKMYAAGKIPGSFFRREGRPGETAILAARSIDRPLRPLFPKNFRNDVQVVVTVLSTDHENNPDLLGLIGASCALMISDIPFYGPVAALRIGLIDNQLVVNPTMRQIEEESTLDLLVAGTSDAVTMVEGSAQQVPESRILEAIRLAHETMQPLLDLQNHIADVVGKTKLQVPAPEERPELRQQIQDWMGPSLWQALYHPLKQERDQATDALRKEVIEHFAEGESEEDLKESGRQVKSLFESLIKQALRQAALERNQRIDGRGSEDVRQIDIEVGLLPRAHGSALFTRGQTQALSVVALGAPGEEQMLDDLGLSDAKRYLHHYNFPPYSVGEARPMRGPRRRDIGHGALAEKALQAILPSKDDFPYAVRVVSEILESNGSSSMASVCGSSLSLMDAGVPLKAAVAGIAMGLISGEDGQDPVLLTDIQGVEDALGDMDLKIAGTASGVTAIQMDQKVHGLPHEVLERAFAQSRQARLHILDKMNAVLDKARPDLSPYAPRIIKVRIDPEKIGAVIGPGGKTIRSIIEASNAEIDVEDDGSIFITTPDADGARIALQMIEELTREAKVGDVYLGRVVRIMPYGAFVNILPNRDGMVHISELEEGRTERVEDVVQIGDEVNVMVTDVDREGKISLSRRAVLTGEMPDEASSRKRSGGRERSDRRQRPRR
ncbi:MAG: polyribonucleotide nucleotidyltransferase [Chloroflexia bacterium]|nr:polyribonucleotide nucleotidyltransferase [Chloroflexia bacterium]